MHSEEIPAWVARFQGNGIEPLGLGSTATWIWARTQRGVYRSAIHGEDTVVDRVFGRNASVALGNGHACILDHQGMVHCLGVNDHGQCGVDGPPLIRVPTRVGLARIAAISAGAVHACALSTEGAVYCWGSPFDPDYDYQYRDPTGDDWRPRRIQLDSAARSIASTHVGACAALVNGTVWCWGRVERFATLSGYAALRFAPYEVVGLPPAEWSLAAGSDHVCALRAGSTHEVWCWGDNRFFQVGADLGDPSVPRALDGLDAASIVVIGERPATCAQTAAGTRCWGWGFGDDVAALSSPARIVDAAHNQLLTEDGRVWEWQPGSPPRDLHVRGRALAADAHGRVCRVSEDGRVLLCGQESSRLARPATDVVLTGLDECVLYESAELACKENGRFEVVNRNVHSACGGSHRLCVLDDRVRCRLGHDEWHDIDVGADVERMSCSRNGRVCALDSDGGVRCERSRDGAVEDVDVPRADDIVVGMHHQCALASGRVYCWSYDGAGFDGNVLGRREDVLPPTRVVGLD